MYKISSEKCFSLDWKQAVFKFSSGMMKFRNLKGRKFQDSENLKFCLKSNSRLHKFRNRINWNLWGVNFNNKLAHRTYLPAYPIVLYGNSKSFKQKSDTQNHMRCQESEIQVNDLPTKNPKCKHGCHIA